MACCGLAAAACVSCNGRATAGGDTNLAHEAAFYVKKANGAVQCGLCPHGCLIPPGRRGFCRVRENQDGVLRSLVYGRPVSLGADPVEKKPFFHVRPGSSAFSLATVGCNLTCQFCQNYDISMANPEDIAVPYRAPEEVARLARESACNLLAFTYTEPVIFYEYMTDCARAAREAGIGNLMISNGFITKRPLEALAPLLTAIKIDLKGFTEEFYRGTCGGRLQPVQETIKTLAALKVWTEVVTLLIPGLNDGEDDIRRLSAWVAKESGPDTPLHFSRFMPSYRMRNLPPTPYSTLRTARELALKEGCRYVYIGNAPGLGGENTACPACGTVVIERLSFRVLCNHLKNGCCPACSTPIPGVWS